MNEKTREEVNRLLNDATYGRYAGKHNHEVRMGALLADKGDRIISAIEYDQLVDALNTLNNTGSYEGCLIWRNAEANPLE